VVQFGDWSTPAAPRADRGVTGHCEGRSDEATPELRVTPWIASLRVRRETGEE
jgi:hypothetical protein